MSSVLSVSSPSLGLICSRDSSGDCPRSFSWEVIAYYRRKRPALVRYTCITEK